MSAKGKGPIFDPGLCRCCGVMKKCRVLNIEYTSFGQKEVYSDMIMDCFGLLLSYLDGKPTERLVCATCVLRVREAAAFRRQVLQCEEAFLQMKMYDGHTTVSQPLLDGSKVEVEIVKREPDEEPSSPSSPCRDALADEPYDGVKDEALAGDDSMSNDDVPLQRYADTSDKLGNLEKLEKDLDKFGSLDRFEKMEKKLEDLDKIGNFDRFEKLEKKLENLDKLEILEKQVLMANGASRQAPVQKLPMAKVQQLMRERDPTYMTESNLLTIVEFSYACPFKCRHNHLLCYYCGQNFSDPLLLRAHTSEVHNPKKFKITEHKNMIKLDLTRIDCRLCSTRIDNLDSFKQHITTAHNKKYYFNYKDSVLPFRLTKDHLKCAICDACFPYFHALNKHMNEHFSNYICETCGLGFVGKGRFVMHQQRHEEGDFPCETCGKVFKAQYNRELHIDRVHNKKGRVYCPKCDLRLMSYPQKLKHLVEVHGEEPLSFPCNLCDKVFETRRTLTIHRRKDHLKDYRYDCKCCGQKFFTRFALNNHMPTHTGERNYKCKVCDKTYPRLKTLKDHMRIHTNDRRYRCHICGQAFIQNCSLKGHMKSQHPEYG